MLEDLKKQVCQANLDLVKHDLVILTWGNVSAFDEKTKYVVIKPSGVDYDTMQPNDMVIVDLDGKVIEGDLKPSSDTLTHLEIYKHFEGVTAVVHTHSKWATIFAQSQKQIPALGTTHADYFNQAIPLTKAMDKPLIDNDYELNTGKVIVDLFTQENINPLYCPAVLVNEHGPFAWGSGIGKAVENAVVLEYVAEMAYHTLNIRSSLDSMSKALHDKHFYRKHGKNKYYGQN